MEHEYKPNSHKYREGKSDVPAERQKVDKVISGVVKTKKKSEIRKFADVFVAEDAHMVKEYLVQDLLIPSIKNTILDLIIEGATIIFKGESGRSRKPGGSSVNYVSYSRYADRDVRDERRYSPSRAGVDFGLDDIYFESRGDAEVVLTRLDEMIETYDRASVADFYDAIGKSCPHTYNNYGWTNLVNAEVIRIRGGDYKLKFPRVKPID